ncbi:MAG TPA: 2OG-Fe(II) oxygenase [Methylibium sp.]|uniref:2OG-Fe(II) oxygenase n=1 Tax=Methylibium sp. TaxID=2067992 RepID=UPI002DBD167C|nr:2OG-Fe(II) oxygenase [Methylibium sp.]HEU4460731.1 2OG-Fe(II) oxygenase [Methylibium sp.]
MNRNEIADLMLQRLVSLQGVMTDQWQGSGPINHCFVDDLLPVELVKRIRAAYPAGSSMKVKRSLREYKYIAAQMDRYDPILEEALFAFQDSRIVDLVGKVTGLRGLEPDAELYAGGISMMSKGHFLNPHIDNSHDKSQDRYRVLNLLYYVSPDWSLANGGNLELWPGGTAKPQITIESRFNRLAIMVTHTKSWHSVSPVAIQGQRCCVSNYYFSREPAESESYFHVTSFRGRPGQKVRDLVLRGDVALRTSIRKLFPQGLLKNKHYYDKK